MRFVSFLLLVRLFSTLCYSLKSIKWILSIHLLIPLPQATKFECQICKNIFKRKECLKQHLQCHTVWSKLQTLFRSIECLTNRPSLQNERFECDQCGLSYKHRYNLKAHQARHHSGEWNSPLDLFGGDSFKGKLTVKKQRAWKSNHRFCSSH